MSTPIGRVLGTEKRPNTAYTFTFWARPEAQIGIGTLVKVVSGDQKVYGVVVQAEGFTDLVSPLHEYLSLGAEPGQIPPTIRPEMRVYEVAVQRRTPEEPVGAVPIGEVFLADEADVRMALRTDGYAETRGIPAGCYGSKSNPIAVHFDSEFLLGPEAGHVNVTGTSGLAAKTSYLLFLLHGILQKQQSAAAFLFNTKGGDLLFLDQAPIGGLPAEDEPLWRACDLDPKVFENVQVYAPLREDHVTPNTLRLSPNLPPVRTFAFGLQEVITHAEVLLNRDDLDAKADGYLQFLNQNHVAKDGSAAIPGTRATTLPELCAIIEKHIEAAEKESGNLKGHSVHTIRKMYNRLSNLQNRFGGLIAQQGRSFGPFDARSEPGSVVVIDVANLRSEEQDLVFAAFISRLRERMELGELGVERLVVAVDELNKYAPSGGGDTYVVRALRDIAARGRYLGLTLFGAQQFRSRVDKEIVGNAATHAFGHIEFEELAQPGYSHFSPAVREKLGSLKTGEMLIKHPHFSQPVFVRFPRPFAMKGSDGMERFKSDRPGAKELVRRELSRFRGREMNRLLDAFANVLDEEPTYRELLSRLQRLPSNEDPIPTIQKTPSKRKIFEAKPPSEQVDSDYDPFES